MQDVIIRARLSALAMDIDRQIDKVRKDSDNMDISISELKNVDGTYVLIPLLLAKAQVLNGLAMLNSANKR